MTDALNIHTSHENKGDHPLLVEETTVRLPVHVAHVIRDLELASGGPSRSVPQLMKAIDDLDDGENWVQHLAFGERGNARAEVGGSTRIVVHPVAETSFPNSLNGLANKLAALHSDFRLSVIHLHGIWSPTLHRVARFARKNQIPYVVSPRGMLSQWCFNHKRFKKRVGWWLYQRSDLQYASAIHVTSADEKRDLRTLGFSDAVSVISNGTDLLPVARGLSTAKTVRLALCITRLHPVKGLDMLLDAWGQLRPEGWRLIIAGPSEQGMKEKLEAQILNLALQQVVEIRGEVDMVAKSDLFTIADLFVLPSRSENFGMSIAEALAHEIPVITTTGTPWSDILNYQCGWIVEPQTESLAVALRTALAEPSAKLEQMGRKGRQLIEDKFTWATVASQMRDLYKSLQSPPPTKSRNS